MFNSIIGNIIAGQVRAAIATLGGVVAASGFLTGEQTTALAGIAASLAAAGWSWFSNARNKKAS